MRIHLQGTLKRIELFDRAEAPALVEFPSVESALRYLRERAAGASAIADLRRQIGGFDVSRLSDDDVLQEAANRLVRREWSIVEHPNRWGGLPIPKPQEESAPPERAAPSRAPEPASEPPQQQCTNPACADAFEDAAEQGTPLVTAGGEGC